MYVTLKSLPVQHKFFNSTPQVTRTLVLPQNKSVEIRASNNELSLYPGQLQNNWFVQESSRVSVHLAKESDVSLTAVTNQKETHGSTPWEQVEDVTKKKILLQKKIQNSTGKNIGIKIRLKPGMERTS